MWYFAFAILCFFITSCNNQKIEKRVDNVLGSTVKFSNIKTVYFNEEEISFKEFRERYKYISIVCLKNNCKPCNDILYNWKDYYLNKVDTDDYSVLFIIEAESKIQLFQEYKMLSIDYSNAYFFIDSTSIFLNDNAKISTWAIDKSILIDYNNKIRMIGVPWLDENMRDLFFRVISN